MLDFLYTEIHSKKAGACVVVAMGAAVRITWIKAHYGDSGPWGGK